MESDAPTQSPPTSPSKKVDKACDGAAAHVKKEGVKEEDVKWGDVKREGVKNEDVKVENVEKDGVKKEAVKEECITKYGSDDSDASPSKPAPASATASHPSKAETLPDDAHASEQGDETPPPPPSPPPPPPPLSEEAKVARERMRRKLAQINAAIADWRPSLPQTQASAPAATKPGDAATAGPRLDADQAAAIAAAKAGHSFFLTGSAGTGKSFVLREIIRTLRGAGRTVAVTASTGCAAVALHGSTIHSLSGVGIGLDSVADLRKRAKGRYISRRLAEPDTLIIDEVSMIDALLLDKIEVMFAVGRESAVTIHRNSMGRPARPNSLSRFFSAAGGRNVSSAPFGGLQVIFCGDFFQLPPVAPSDRTLQFSKDKYFAFEAESWRRAIKQTFVLRQVHRQSDGCFVALLNEVRLGLVSSATRTALQSCFIPARAGVDCTEADESGRFLRYTKLFSYRRQVEAENEVRLRALGAQAVVYHFRDTVDKTKFGMLSESSVLKLLDSSNASTEVVVKLGARVLCLKNLDVEHGVCNGSAGVVVGFALPAEQRLLLRRKRDDVKEGELVNMEGLREEEIRPLDDETIAKSIANARRDAFGAIHMDCAMAAVYPVVEFDNGVKMEMVPANWEVFNMQGVVCAARMQIPLTLGWALSIHKSQGMTLNLVETDLASAFDFGQVYVALSRATSMQGLRLTSFRAEAVRTHEKVKEFYAELDTDMAQKEVGGGAVEEEMVEEEMMQELMRMEEEATAGAAPKAGPAKARAAKAPAAKGATVQGVPLKSAFVKRQLKKRSAAAALPTKASGKNSVEKVGEARERGSMSPSNLNKFKRRRVATGED